jgi:ribosomal protein S18 acetylase RimI-like enzyme
MIRAVTPDDVPDVVALAVDSELFPPEEAGAVEALMAGFFGARAGDGHACLVDEGDGALRAVAYYQPVAGTDRAWELLMIGVHRSRHRTGLGRVLLGRVEDDLRARGQRLLVVLTSADPAFARARAFYAALGYDEEARVRDYYADGDDMVLFRRAL